MVLIARTSIRDDFSPQGLLENVLTPLVMHCQIWPFCAGGSDVPRAWAVVCAWVACSGAVSESGTEAGITAGAAATAVVSVGTVATLVEVAGPGNDGESGADVTCAVAAPTGDKLGAAVLPVEATVMTTATAATDSPPKIQGSRSVWFFMGRLSSRGRASAANINKN